jgi:hypothetical protein
MQTKKIVNQIKLSLSFIAENKFNKYRKTVYIVALIQTF